jgi:hypothetical protein
MFALRELQRGVARAILGHEEASILEAIQDDGIAPEARLRIYRHHYETSLTEALKAIYPAVCLLVDERFFAFAAHAYIRAAPPRRVCLHEYGESFPEFLAEFPPCRNLAYLPDVARLEWVINAALHSPIEEPLTGSDFVDLAFDDYPGLVFRLLPSLGYLQSPWPVDRIWRDEAVDLTEGGVFLEIRQRGEAVVFRRLEEGDFTLRRALLSGESLASAGAAALARDPAVDLAMALRRLLTEGLVTGFSLSPRRPRDGEEGEQ